MLEKIYQWIGVACLVMLGLAALPFAIMFIFHAIAAVIAIILIVTFIDSFYG